MLALIAGLTFFFFVHRSDVCDVVLLGFYSSPDPFTDFDTTRYPSVLAFAIRNFSGWTRDISTWPDGWTRDITTRPDYYLFRSIHQYHHNNRLPYLPQNNTNTESINHARHHLLPLSRGSIHLGRSSPLLLPTDHHLTRKSTPIEPHNAPR